MFGFKNQFAEMVNWKSIAIFIAFFLVSYAAWSNYFYQHFSVANGLPNNQIQCLFKDRYGFLWIGTNNGLSQYDGYSFRNFLHNPNDPTSLPSNDVRSISEDQSGRLWVGLWGGVATFDQTTQKFSVIKLPFEHSNDRIMHILCDSKNRLWISTTEGNYLFTIQGKLIKHWRAGKGKHDLPHDHIVQTLEDASGNIWITGRCGLCRFREATMDYEVIPDNHPPYIEKNGWLNSVNEGISAKNGILWFGSWANGLRRIDPKTKNFKSWLTKPEFKGHGAYNVISGTAEFDGKIWVASHDQGLGFLDEEKDSLIFLKNLPLQGYNLPIRKTTRLLADEFVLWIATSNGLYKYDLRKQLFEVFRVPNLVTGSCLPEIQSITEYQTDQLIVCTWTCGLFSFNSKTNKSQNIPIPFEKKQSSVWDLDLKNIFLAKDSTLWISTSHGMFQQKKGAWKSLLLDKSKTDLNRQNYFFKILPYQNGQYWAASGNGIVKIDPETADIHVVPLQSIAEAFANLTSEIILDMDVAPNGDVWFLRKHGGKLNQIGFTVLRKATGKWVTYVAGQGKFKDYPFAHSCHNIKATSDGQIYVSSERGLVCFNGTNPQKFESFSSYHGLLADVCYGMTEDDFGKLWILAPEGISSLDLNTKKIRVFTENDGLPEAANFGISKLTSGQIAIGHNNSWLTILKPDRLQKYTQTSDRFSFTRLEVENQTLWPRDSITFSPEANVVRLAYSPLNFLSSFDQIFTIQINRSGQETRYQTPSNEITLSDLRPGWYEIKVSAPGLKTIDFHFYKEPRFWQTTWFIVVSILLGFVVITSLLLFRQRQVLRKKEKERNLQFQMADMQMAALRSQIDAHFIFNALNAINQFIWQKMPEQAADFLTQFARLMRINLEHTRTDWVSLDEELQAVEYYFNLESLTLEHAPTLIWEIENLPDKSELSIPPMLMQPIVENVFKHGFQLMNSPGVLHISLKKIDDMLLFTAKDNGPGPKEGKKETSGHTSLASKILNERLELLNQKSGKKARFTLTRELENGTWITVSAMLIPMQKWDA